MNSLTNGWKVGLLGSILLAGPQLAAAQDFAAARSYYDKRPTPKEPEAVMLVDVFYGKTNRNSKGDWHAGNPRVLPCAAPSKPSITDGASSLILVTDAQGRPLYSRQLRNPRLILVEDPKEEPPLLSDLDFTMRVPFSREMTHLQFFEHGRQQKDPSFVVELPKAVKTFFEKGGHDRYAPCQIPFDGRIVGPRDRGDDGDIDNGIPPETMLAIVRANPGAAVDAATAAGLSARDVRRLVQTHRKTLRRLGVSNKEIREFMRLLRRKSGPRRGYGGWGKIGSDTPKAQTIAPQSLVDQLSAPRGAPTRKR